MLVGMSAPIGVSNMPGARHTTLIWNLPRSRARGRVIPMMAPLEAEYILYPLCPSIPATLATLMITPFSLISSLALG